VVFAERAMTSTAQAPGYGRTAQRAGDVLAANGALMTSMTDLVEA
jgi:hypothetical protein